MFPTKTEVKSWMKDETDHALFMWFHEEIQTIIWIGTIQQHPTCTSDIITFAMPVHNFGCAARKRMLKMEEIAAMERSKPEYAMKLALGVMNCLKLTCGLVGERGLA